MKPCGWYWTMFNASYVFFQLKAGWLHVWIWVQPEKCLFYASKPLYTYFSRQLLERLPFLLSVFFPFYRLRCIFHVSRSGAPCRCDFPMQRYSVCPVVKYRCVLSCSRIERQPSTNHRFGYSAKFQTIYLPFAVLALLLESHVKFIPKASRKDFKKREIKTTVFNT